MSTTRSATEPGLAAGGETELRGDELRNEKLETRSATVGLAADGDLRSEKL